jgi:hypothetical protein
LTIRKKLLLSFSCAEIFLFILSSLSLRNALLDYVEMVCKQISKRFIDPPKWWTPLPNPEIPNPSLRKPDLKCHEDKKTGIGRLCIRCQDEEDEEERDREAEREKEKAEKKDAVGARQKARERMKRKFAEEQRKKQEEATKKQKK